MNYNQTSYKNSPMFKYVRSEKGIITRAYMKMKYKKFFTGYKFTKKQLIKWYYDNNYKEMYQRYFDSNFDVQLKPTIDRIDEYGIYEFSNMQLLTWRENHLKGARSIKNIKQFELNRMMPNSGPCKYLTLINKDTGSFFIFESHKSVAKLLKISPGSIAWRLNKNIFNSRNTKCSRYIFLDGIKPFADYNQIPIYYP